MDDYQKALAQDILNTMLALSAALEISVTQEKDRKMKKELKERIAVTKQNIKALEKKLQ